MCHLSIKLQYNLEKQKPLILIESFKFFSLFNISTNQIIGLSFVVMEMDAKLIKFSIKINIIIPDFQGLYTYFKVQYLPHTLH